MTGYFVGAPSLGSSDGGAVYKFPIRSPLVLADSESASYDFASGLPNPHYDYDRDGVDMDVENGCAGRR